MNKLISRITLFILLVGFAPVGLAQDENAKPNVIVILTDDQGSIDMGSYGADDLHTPNMDRLAEGGVRFTQFYAGAPVCSPSRAALLTGKSNLRAGLPNNVPIPERAEARGQFGLPSNQVTMAEMLKENDYFTALIGKWHLGHRPENLPNAQGFDYFFGHQRGVVDNYSHFFYWDGPNIHDLYRNDEEVYYPGEHFSDLMVKEITTILEDKERENPFFIYWAFNAPHYPYQGDPKWLEHFNDLPSPRKEYAAFVSHMDESIGQVLDYLDENDLSDNTIIVFQSDHGHSKEERALWGGGDSGDFRGSKFSLFEGGLRVPAVIKYPHVIPAGEVRNQLALSVDWFATIAELTKSDFSENIDGKSLMPIIDNKNQETAHQVVNWQYGNYRAEDSQWAIRKGPWKLIGNVSEPLKYGGRSDLPDLFLVNLDDDISEEKNVADENPDKLNELIQLHKSWLEAVRAEMNVN